MARAKLTLAGVRAYLQQRAPNSGVRYTWCMKAIERTYRRIIRAAKSTKLPGIEEIAWWGRPSLAVKGKGFMGVKDEDTLVVRCALEEKEVLMEVAPEIYFETDHYKGWPAVLVRTPAISDAELAHCIARAWRLMAPKKLLKEVEQAAKKSAPPANNKSRAKKRR